MEETRLYQQLKTKVKNLASESKKDPIGSISRLQELGKELEKFERQSFNQDHLKAISKHNVTFTNPGSK